MRRETTGKACLLCLIEVKRRLGMSTAVSRCHAIRGASTCPSAESARSRIGNVGRSFKVDNVCCELTYVDNDDEWCLSANCLLCGEMSDSVPLNQLRPDRPMRLRCGIRDLFRAGPGSAKNLGRNEHDPQQAGRPLHLCDGLGAIQPTRPASQLICPAKYASTAIQWQSATGMEACRGATWTSTSSSEEVTIRAGPPRPGKPPSRPASQPGCPDSQPTHARGQKARFPDLEAPFPGQTVCIAGRVAQEPDGNRAAGGLPAWFRGRTPVPGPLSARYSPTPLRPTPARCCSRRDALQSAEWPGSTPLCPARRPDF